MLTHNKKVHPLRLLSMAWRLGTLLFSNDGTESFYNSRSPARRRGRGQPRGTPRGNAMSPQSSGSLEFPESRAELNRHSAAALQRMGSPWNSNTTLPSSTLVTEEAETEATKAALAIEVKKHRELEEKMAMVMKENARRAIRSRGFEEPATVGTYLSGLTGAGGSMNPETLKGLDESELLAGEKDLAELLAASLDLFAKEKVSPT